MDRVKPDSGRATVTKHPWREAMAQQTKNGSPAHHRLHMKPRHQTTGAS
jgi:hypothetical protein